MTWPSSSPLSHWPSWRDTDTCSGAPASRGQATGPTRSTPRSCVFNSAQLLRSLNSIKPTDAMVTQDVVSWSCNRVIKWFVLPAQLIFQWFVSQAVRLQTRRSYYLYHWTKISFATLKIPCGCAKPCTHACVMIHDGSVGEKKEGKEVWSHVPTLCVPCARLLKHQPIHSNM